MLPIFIIGLICSAIVYADSSHISVSSSLLDGQSLALRLLQSPIHDQEVFSQAVTVLESLQSGSSCHRAATVSLIDSCQSLDSLDEGNSPSEVREKYAARLAMCELMGAKVELPSQCKAFAISEHYCLEAKSKG